MTVRNSLVALCLCSSLGFAQVGTGSGGCDIGPGFECSLVHGHDRSGREQRNWVRAIVLWKGDSHAVGGLRDTAAARVRQERYTAARRAAEDAGRIVIGAAGVARLSTASMTWGFGRRTRDTLFVEDRQFELPQRDSALVVMIDMPPGEPAQPPQLAAVTWIAAELDLAYWPKHWTSGDTSFTVMPRRGNSILRDALLKSPRVRSFVLGTP